MALIVGLDIFLHHVDFSSTRLLLNNCYIMTLDSEFYVPFVANYDRDMDWIWWNNICMLNASQDMWLMSLSVRYVLVKCLLVTITYIIWIPTVVKIVHSVKRVCSGTEPVWSCCWKCRLKIRWPLWSHLPHRSCKKTFFHSLVETLQQ